MIEKPLQCPFCGAIPELFATYNVHHWCTTTSQWFVIQLDAWNTRYPRFTIPIIYAYPKPEPYYVPPSWI